jgi:hypothetical protein
MERNVFVRGYALESYERLILQKHTIFLMACGNLKEVIMY